MIGDRKKLKFVLIIPIILILFISIGWGYTKWNRSPQLSAKRKIARRLLLTDFSLSTESRHTRNIALPEYIAPFQDLPGFHDHFPSSSFYQPYNTLKPPY